MYHIYRWYIIEPYVSNLYNCVNQCYPNEFNKIKKIIIIF